MSQLRLPLGLPEAHETEFLVGESNARAVHQLEHWATWPVMSALLVGPRKSGRSLLARIFASKSGGRIFDDADRAKETDIFHAWNEAQQERRPLLIVAEAAPPVWDVKLPDLRSRLAASPLLELGPPDDTLMPQLIERSFRKAFAARQTGRDRLGRETYRTQPCRDPARCRRTGVRIGQPLVDLRSARDTRGERSHNRNGRSLGP